MNIDRSAISTDLTCKPPLILLTTFLYYRVGPFFGLQGHDLNKLGRGSLDYATYTPQNN